MPTFFLLSPFVPGYGIGILAFWELLNRDEGGGPAGVVEAAATDVGGSAAGVVDGLEKENPFKLGARRGLVSGVDGGLRESGTWNIARSGATHTLAGKFSR